MDREAGMTGDPPQAAGETAKTGASVPGGAEHGIPSSGPRVASSRATSAATRSASLNTDANLMRSSPVMPASRSNSLLPA